MSKLDSTERGQNGPLMRLVDGALATIAVTFVALAALVTGALGQLPKNGAIGNNPDHAPELRARPDGRAVTCEPPSC